MLFYSVAIQFLRSWEPACRIPGQLRGGQRAVFVGGHKARSAVRAPAHAFGRIAQMMSKRDVSAGFTSIAA